MAQTNQSEIEETLADKVKRLIEIKLELMKTINLIGGSCDPSDPFDTYPEKIRSAKGTFNIKNELTIDEYSKTYYAKDFDVTGWDKVTVNLQKPADGSGSGSGSDYPGGGSGYPGGGSGYPGGGDGIDFGDVDVAKFTVTFSNPYDPDWIDEEHTVEVEEGQFATAPDQSTVKYKQESNPEENQLWRLQRWEPDNRVYPINESGIVFTAKFKKKGSEIEDDWSDIIANPDDYDITDWKYAYFGTVSYTKMEFGDYNKGNPPIKHSKKTASNGGRLRMTKVHGKGIGGSSVWMSDGVELYNGETYDSLEIPYYLPTDGTPLLTANQKFADYGQSYVKDWLSSVLLKAIDPTVASGMKSITHGYVRQASWGPDNTPKVTEKLWLPSYAEAFEGTYTGCEPKAIKFSGLAKTGINRTMPGINNERADAPSGECKGVFWTRSSLTSNSKQSVACIRASSSAGKTSFSRTDYSKNGVAYNGYAIPYNLCVVPCFCL